MDVPYNERLKIINILPLSFRRDIAGANFFYKCMNGLNSINIHDYVWFTRESTVYTRNTSDSTLLVHPMCKTTLYSRVYFNRIVHTWNSLPVVIRNSATFGTFRYLLFQHCKLISDRRYDPINSCTWFLECQN